MAFLGAFIGSKLLKNHDEFGSGGSSDDSLSTRDRAGRRLYLKQVNSFGKSGSFCPCWLGPGRIHLLETSQFQLYKFEAETLKGDVQFPREKSKPISLKRSGDHYKTTITGISKTHRFDIHVELESGGQKGKADFGIDNIN